MASPAKTILGRRRESIPLAKYAPSTPSRAVASSPAVPIRPTTNESRTMRKIDQTARILDKLDAKIADLAADIKALNKIKAQADALRERIEDGAITYMQIAGLDSMHGRTRQFSLRTAPPAVAIANASLIPDDYLRETVTTAPDKVEIKRQLLAGVDIPGCSLTTKVGLNRK